jgi:hypothetical protein
MTDITQDYLKEILDYEPKTGVFVWRSCARPDKTGRKAGWFDAHGYNRIMINNKAYVAHRLAWLYVTGNWPKEYIDHINNNPADNRFCNLREATPRQNSANQGIRKRNLAGYKGVIKHRLKWKAQFTHNYQTIYLGLFDTPEQAHAAYSEAAQQLNGQFARVA